MTVWLGVLLTFGGNWVYFANVMLAEGKAYYVEEKLMALTTGSLLSRGERCLQWATEWMLEVCSWPGWTVPGWAVSSPDSPPSSSTEEQWLGMAALLRAVSFAYDVLEPHLTEREKQVVQNAVSRFGDLVYDDYMYERTWFVK